jgi:hypothetical protein
MQEGIGRSPSPITTHLRIAPQGHYGHWVIWVYYKNIKEAVAGASKAAQRPMKGSSDVIFRFVGVSFDVNFG